MKNPATTEEIKALRKENGHLQRFGRERAWQAKQWQEAADKLQLLLAKTLEGWEAALAFSEDGQYSPSYRESVVLLAREVMRRTREEALLLRAVRPGRSSEQSEEVVDRHS